MVVMIIKRKQTRSFYMITLTLTIKQLLIWQVASLSRQIGQEIGPMQNYKHFKCSVVCVVLFGAPQ